MKSPLVSIIIPTYNRAGLIGETIQSVIAQTVSDWELIIVDDGSNDTTDEVIAQFADKRIQYHRIDHSGVIGKARNYGMRLSYGAYIAFLDSDDLWRPDKLEFQFSLLNQFPETSFIFSNGVHFGDDESLPAELENLFVGEVFLPMIEEERFIFFVPSFMFKREVLQKVSPIDETLISGGDIDFYFRVSHLFKGIFTNERLVKIRKHGHGTSQGREAAAYLEFIIMLNRFYNGSIFTKEQFNKIIARQYYRLGMLYLRQKNFKDAKDNFQKYNLINPVNYKGWIRMSEATVRSLTVYVS